MRPFRADTIKGSARLFGCEHMVHFTHEVETLLEELRAGRMALSEPWSPCCCKAGTRWNGCCLKSRNCRWTTT